jgi:hypothetical protein
MDSEKEEGYAGQAISIRRVGDFHEGYGEDSGVREKGGMVG